MTGFTDDDARALERNGALAVMKKPLDLPLFKEVVDKIAGFGKEMHSALEEIKSEEGENFFHKHNQFVSEYIEKKMDLVGQVRSIVNRSTSKVRF